MIDSGFKHTFRCPHCGQKLSFLDGNIVKLVGRLHGDNFSCKTMFYVPANLGEYGAIVGEGVRLQDGARVEFECISGACKANLTSAFDQDLAEVKMVREDGKEFAVVFNKTYGRHSTFLVDVTEKALVESYGEHAGQFQPDFDKPINFFGV
jgi:hypothetical protein